MRSAGGVLGRLRGERRHRQAGVPLPPHRPADPGLEHQALHHRRGAGPLRRGRPARDRGPRHRRARARTAPSAATSTWSAAATPPSAAAASRAAPTAAAARSRSSRRSSRSAGIRRVTGRVVRRRVAVRLAAAAGPDSRLPDLALRRPAQRPVLQPRPGQRERPRLPGQPARVRGRPARRGAGAARHLGDAAPRGPAGPPADGARAGHRAVADDGAPGGAHQQAVGQLLRRDADQGPGRPGRRHGHHQRPARGWRRAFARRLGGRPAAPGRRLGPLARQPRLALPGGEAAAGDAQARRVRRRSSTRCRSRAATAPCGPRMRGGPARGRCRGKTGTISTSPPCRATAARARARPTSSRS